jgi:hypothetical protein
MHYQTGPKGSFGMLGSFRFLRFSYENKPIPIKLMYDSSKIPANYVRAREHTHKGMKRRLYSTTATKAGCPTGKWKWSCICSSPASLRHCVAIPCNNGISAIQLQQFSSHGDGRSIGGSIVDQPAGCRGVCLCRLSTGGAAAQHFVRSGPGMGTSAGPCRHYSVPRARACTVEGKQIQGMWPDCPSQVVLLYYTTPVLEYLSSTSSFLN